MNLVFGIRNSKLEFISFNTIFLEFCLDKLHRIRYPLRISLDLLSSKKLLVVLHCFFHLVAPNRTPLVYNICQLSRSFTFHGKRKEIIVSKCSIDGSSTSLRFAQTHSIPRLILNESTNGLP